jgi:octaprenyl-diphosphate synthase
MHTATLLHDDVVDESDLRRGRSTARMIWGNQASVLVGDFLLGQAFKMMVEVGSLEALDVLSTAASVIAEGEVLQLSVAKNMETTEDDYLSVIRAKTAALFSAACEVGPIMAGVSKAERNALRSYGMNLGLAFQLIDDVLDYGGSARDLGKNVGDDFREGKITLPVVLAYRRGSESERAFWREAIEGGKSDDQALEKALGLITKYGSLKDTTARAEHYASIARDALAPLPDSAEKAALLEVIAFCVNRATRSPAQPCRIGGNPAPCRMRQKSHCVGQICFGKWPARGQFEHEARLDAAKYLKARLAASVALGVFLSMGGPPCAAPQANAQATTTQEQSQPNFMGFAGAFSRRRTADMDNDTGNAIEFYSKALEFDPENIEVKQRLMVALFTDGGGFPKAWRWHASSRKIPRSHRSRAWRWRWRRPANASTARPPSCFPARKQSDRPAAQHADECLGGIWRWQGRSGAE